MKTKWGALIVDGRGKLGGHVASKNRNGSYLRTKTTPVNPQTSFQTAVRAAFGVFSQQWSGLSAALIAAWNNAVSDWSTTDIFGDLKNPTGKNLFLRLNQQATQAGYPSFTAVPAKAEMVEGVITGVSIGTVTSELDPAGRYTGADARVMVYATPILSAGTSFVKNKLRLIYTQLGTDFDTADAYAAYVARFGAPTVGANIKIGIRYCLANGQVSPMQTITAVVAAV